MCPGKSYYLIYYVILFLNASRILVLSELVESENRVVDEGFCKTSGCYEAATLITQNIDEKIDPCDNFYKFACGHFIEKVAIPENKGYVSRMDAIAKKIKSDIVLMLEKETKPDEPKIFKLVRNYFKACMDTVTIDSLGAKPILDVIEKLGGWPMVDGDSWNENNFDLLEMMIKLRNLGFQHKYLVNIYVYNNYLNTSHYQLYIDKAEQCLNQKDLSEDFETSSTLDAYISWMVDVAVEFGANRTTARKEALKVLEFEQILSQLSYVDSQAHYEIKRITDLETNLPWFPWLSYLNNITYPFIKFDRNSDVYTDEPYYLELLVEYLRDVDTRTLVNYLIWRAIIDSFPHLSKNIRELRDPYYEPEEEDRLDRCIKWLNSNEIGLPVGVSALYIREYFNNETRREVKEIVHAIVDQFQDRLKNVTWLDGYTKERARRKSEYMKRIVGHPDEMLNDQILNNYIENLEIHPKNHFNNILNIRRFQYENSLSLYNEHGNYLWTIFSPEVTKTNALYYSTSNSFAILAGILRRPLFNAEWPSYAKYGSIGFMIGHEMMHAYDWYNFKFDETGSLKHWYSNESEAEYRKRLDCFEEQYAQFTDEDLDLSIDGKLTLDENIADNVGLKVAYDAFEAERKKDPGNPANLRLPGLKYTPEQLFWIYSVNFLCSKDLAEHRVYSMADRHAPDHFRALGEMSNSQHFADTFQCKEGSPMNPVKKCKLV